MGLLKVDDQLERRPVAILQTAHFGGQFQKKSAGGGSNPSAPTFVALTVRSIAFFHSRCRAVFCFSWEGFKHGNPRFIFFNPSGTSP